MDIPDIIIQYAPEDVAEVAPKTIIETIPGFPEIVVEMADESNSIRSQGSTSPDSSFFSVLRSTWRSVQQAFRNSIHL